MITTKKSLIIFDGIDEVVEKAPWIIKAIISFHERYPKAQIIVSSRMTGPYINEIPFIGLTLLPFTDSQRKNFFKMWFNDDSKVEAVLKHLDEFQELNEIVRNPLLATIMCVLAEHSVPLPDTEIRLYEERFRLLLGHYDVHKQSARIKSHHQDLWYIARKIAYYFHLKQISYAAKSTIIDALHEIYCAKMPPTQIDLGVAELIDPCTVLKPMTEDGQFGFGHLRFQEYLVACELKENRGLSIEDYLLKKTWRGALILFSQMTDDIEHIIEKLIVFEKITPYIDAITAMLKVRSVEEREYLGKIVANNLTQDDYETFMEFYKQSRT